MRALVAVFPGSNREKDVARALRLQTGVEPRFIWHEETEIPSGCDLVVLPGGFSYGDYLRCGAIAARSPLMEAIRRYAHRGGRVLGICNGFQILCESGLLPGLLIRNVHLRFICRFLSLRIERCDTDFTRAYHFHQIIQLPVAHGEGQYMATPDVLAQLEDEGRVALRYCGTDGTLGEESNLNGSAHSIAGIYSERLNILGLMPHPENAVDPAVGETEGCGFFRSLAGLMN